jgi:fructose-1,6-bisphosphatase/inositol monophosphatase family enzyme
VLIGIAVEKTAVAGVIHQPYWNYKNKGEVLIGIAVGKTAVAGVIHQPYWNYKNKGDTNDIVSIIWADQIKCQNFKFRNQNILLLFSVRRP